MGKQGKWSTPKIVLTADNDAPTVIVSGKNGKRRTIAFEYVRRALPDKFFARLVKGSIEKVDGTIEHAVDDVICDKSDSIKNYAKEQIYHEDPDFSACGTYAGFLQLKS